MSLNPCECQWQKNFRHPPQARFAWSISYTVLEVCSHARNARWCDPKGNGRPRRKLFCSAYVGNYTWQKFQGKVNCKYSNSCRRQRWEGATDKLLQIWLSLLNAVLVIYFYFKYIFHLSSNLYTLMVWVYTAFTHKWHRPKRIHDVDYKIKTWITCV